MKTRPIASCLSIACALLVTSFAPALSAQTSSDTVPAGFDRVEGNAHFFAWGAARTLSGVAPLSRNLTITQMAFRRDGVTNTGVPRRLDIKVTLSTGNLNYVYADTKRIHGADQAVVFDQKAVSFPDWSQTAGSPAPFDFVLKFTKPFAYKGGDLVWQVDYTNATRRDQAQMDRQVAGLARGSGLNIGTGCAKFTHTMRLENNGAMLGANGMRMHLRASGSVKNAATWLLIDFKASGISVPGLCSRLFALPTVFAQIYSTDDVGDLSGVYIGFPYTKAVEGSDFYSQLMSFDSSQAGLPFLMSNGYRSKMPANSQMAGSRACFMFTDPAVGTAGSMNFGGSIVLQFK